MTYRPHDRVLLHGTGFTIIDTRDDYNKPVFRIEIPSHLVQVQIDLYSGDVADWKKKMQEWEDSQ